MANDPSFHVEVAIIGAGTAGMGAFRAARRHTDSVVLIDPGPFGTTCARVGCMPSKLLIAAADAAHAVQRAPGFGLRTGAVEVDGRAVMARVRSERDRFVGFVLDTVEAWPASAIIRQRARFIAPMTLGLDDGRQIHAGRIVIASGSRPRIPPGWREALGERLLTNDEVFAWDDLPRSVAVVGGGVIGLELGQALARLGVRVRLLQRGRRLGGLSDPAIAAVAAEVLARELPLSLDATIDAVERAGDGVRLRYRDAHGIHVEHVDYLLCAIGREPNLAGLDLAQGGIPVDAHGVPPSHADTCQIADLPVFLAGDAADRRLLLHEAADDGRIAGDNAGRFPDVRVRPRRAGLAIVFSDPQIAIAGRGLAELTADGVDLVQGAVDFSDQGRSRILLRHAGRLHVYGERHTGRFLGAEMIAPDAEHLAHLLSWAAQNGMTVQQMLDAPFYHPVVEEGVRTALRDLQHALQMGPVPVERCLDCGPGA
jgi:dihydrolipoamide dehydrogenase